MKSNVQWKDSLIYYLSKSLNIVFKVKILLYYWPKNYKNIKELRNRERPNKASVIYSETTFFFNVRQMSQHHVIPYFCCFARLMTHNAQQKIFVCSSINVLRVTLFTRIVDSNKQ